MEVMRNLSSRKVLQIVDEFVFPVFTVTGHTLLFVLE